MLTQLSNGKWINPRSVQAVYDDVEAGGACVVLSIRNQQGNVFEVIPGETADSIADQINEACATCN